MPTVYSDDQDILAYEPDIIRFLPESQPDYSRQHREAKKLILNKLLKDKVIQREEDLLKTEELRVLSVYKTLQLVFGFLTANEGDSFADKAEQRESDYNSEYSDIRNTLSVDRNQDGQISESERLDSHQTIVERW